MDDGEDFEENPLDGEGYEENPLVRALVEDAANPPPLLSDEGLIGRSSRRGYTRFYTERTLQEYYDLPDQSVVRVVRLPPGERPFRPDAIWVDPEKLGDSPAIYRNRDTQKPLNAAELPNNWTGGGGRNSEDPQLQSASGVLSPNGGGDNPGGGGRGKGTSPKYRPP
jgi:hypothetical protein